MPAKEPHGDRPARQRRPAETTDHFTRLHGSYCRCAYCSRELTDEWSISAGYGPVCARKNDLPWGGPVGLSDGSIPVEEPQARSRTLRLRELGRRARSAASRARRAMAPRLRDLSARIDRLGRAALADRRRTALAAGAVTAALVLGVVLVAGLAGPGTAAAQQAEAAAAAPRAVVVEGIKQPFVVRVQAGTPQQVCEAETAALARAAAEQVLPVVATRPRQLVAIHLQDLPMSFHALTDAQQSALAQQFGPNVDGLYESAVASLLKALLSRVDRAHPGAALSVLGLPVEPEQAGVSIDKARDSNDRYRAVIDRLGPFVPARRFVVFGSTLDEQKLASLGMREALRLRDGRPIVFQTNLAWRALVDAEGLDEHGDPILGPGRDGHGRAAFQMEVLLQDE